MIRRINFEVSIADIISSCPRLPLSGSEIRWLPSAALVSSSESQISAGWEGGPGGCLWLESPGEGTDRENTLHFDWEWPRSLRFQGMGFSLPGSPVLVEYVPLNSCPSGNLRLCPYLEIGPLQVQLVEAMRYWMGPSPNMPAVLVRTGGPGRRPCGD